MSDQTTWTARESELVMDFVLGYYLPLEKAQTAHAKAQRALLRRMLADIGVDYGEILSWPKDFADIYRGEDVSR